MDGVCIKIGLIFPVALQEAIKKLETPLLVLAGLYFQSSLNKRGRERERELEREEKENSI